MRSNRRRSKNIFDKLNDVSIVWIIIAVSVIFSIIGFVMFYLNLAEYIALKPISILQGKYLWTLVTHIFVHGGPLHLFINMFVLFSLGMLCERIIGRKRFFWFYLISGIFAGILSVLLAGFFGYGFWEKVFGSPDVLMVGASGAIFAIAGLFVILLPNIRFSIIFLPFFSLPGWIMIPAVLFVTWIASILGGFPIGNVAHFGGFVAGIGYGIYLRYKYNKKVKMLQRYFK